MNFYQVAHRNHESDVDLPEATKKDGCKDIARQLIEEFPGKALNVAFGGGRKCMFNIIKNFEFRNK